jgi:hypothetical protein
MDENIKKVDIIAEINKEKNKKIWKNIDKILAKIKKE